MDEVINLNRGGDQLPTHEEEIQTRLDRATPPKWKLDKRGNVSGVAKVKKTSDAELIVNAPDDLTYLLDGNETLTDVNEVLVDRNESLVIENGLLVGENAELNHLLEDSTTNNHVLRLVIEEMEEESERETGHE